MRLLRAGICILVAFSVLAHGAVEPWSEAILEIGAALLLLSWGVMLVRSGELPLRWNPLLGPLLGFLAFVLFQVFAHRTVYLYLTKIELLQLAALVLLVFLAVQAYDTSRQWGGFVWFLLALGFAVSVFGILQHFTFNGKLYWFRELRYGGIPFGPYVNRNHFAGFIEVVVPSGLALLVFRAGRRDQLPLVALFTLLPIGALFLAASRGGVASFLVELGLLAILILVRRGEKRAHLAAATVVLVLAGAVVAWLGVGRALERFEKLQSLEVSENRRVGMIKDSWRIFLDHPWTGTGLGTLPSVYPRYETYYDGKVVNHAHNDYVELLADTGVVGGLFCLWFLVLLACRGWTNLSAARRSIDFALHGGALVACGGLLVHSLVDFNLHIPSNALIFLLQAALATSVFGRSHADHLVEQRDTFADNAA